MPDQHTTLLGSSGGYLAGNADTAAAFLRATRRGYAHAVDHPGEAADILVAANAAALTDPALVRASLAALNEGHYLRSAAGVIGTIDPAKIEAMGRYLFASGILLDPDGVPLKEAPDFSAWYSNRFLQAG